MALVQIARFADITEAQVVAAALRSAGIVVQLENENYGQTFYLVQQALGGFGLWVPSEDAADARAFVADGRSQPREPVASPQPAKRLIAVVLAFVFGAA